MDSENGVTALRAGVAKSDITTDAKDPAGGRLRHGGCEVTECFLGAGWQEIYERTASDILRRL